MNSSKENPSHGTPPADDFAKLSSDATFIGQLGFDPEVMIREQITAMLVEEVPGTVVEWIKVTDEPRQLTAGIQGETNFTVTRVGIAVPVEFSALAPSERREVLWGVLTYTQTGMNRPEAARRRMWLDLRESLDWAEEQLQPRLFEQPGERN